MNVIVDTCVWSLALRRNSDTSLHRKILEDLISDGRARLTGAIRQETLSGIKSYGQFENLRTTLQSFPNLQTTIQDYEMAAEYFNTCRSNGVQGANTDFLLCAMSVNRDYKILTTNKDFQHFLRLLPIRSFTQAGY